MIVEKDTKIPNSFSLASRAKFVVPIGSKEDLLGAVQLAQEQNLPLLPLGEATNVILNRELNAVVALINIKGIDGNEILKIGAGERWDDVVEFAVERGLSGIETLSLIPGKAGSAPIQNIGAYGSEIADTLLQVEAYDTIKNEFVVLDKKDCEFGYRDSLFKKNPGRFIIVSIFLQLSKTPPTVPDYKDVRNYFEERKIASPTLRQIRQAIIEIRQGKLPDYQDLPNCGSFFKNPIVENELAEKIKLEFPDLLLFPADDKTKIPAGFLIEKAGLKGKTINNIKIYDRNALVLTNPNNASFTDLLSAKDQIIKIVSQKFGIVLEPEVSIINI